MSWGGDFKFVGRVEASEPMRYLRSVPVFPPGMEPPVKMATEVWLEAHAGMMIMRIVQSGFLADASWDAEYDGTRRGWHFQLRGLKLYLEKHRGTPRRVAWARQMISVPREQAWKRLMSAEGLLREGRVEGLREGERYRIVTAGGDAFEGNVHAIDPPRNFSGTAENRNTALVSVWLDDLPMRGYKDVNLWLSTYGVPQADVDALKTLFA